MPLLKAEIRALLHDTKTARLKSHLPWTPSNSLLRQLIQLLSLQLSQANLQIIDVDDSTRTITIHANNFATNAAIADTSISILIGTGTNPVTMTDTHLQTQVTANIVHGATAFAIENPDANTWRLAISRTFLNQTGATVPVKEAALYVYAHDPEPYGRKICIDRTLYSVDVTNGTTLTLTYRITVQL